MCILPLILLCTAGPVDGHPATWEFHARWLEDGHVRVELTCTLEPGWHLYATELPSDQGPLPTVVRFNDDAAFALAGPIEEPEAVEEYDPNFAMVVRHHSGVVPFGVVLDPRGEGPFEISGEVEYMLCNDVTCLPPTAVPFKLAVARPDRSSK